MQNEEIVARKINARIWQGVCYIKSKYCDYEDLVLTTYLWFCFYYCMINKLAFHGLHDFIKYLYFSTLESFYGVEVDSPTCRVLEKYSIRLINLFDHSDVSLVDDGGYGFSVDLNTALKSNNHPLLENKYDTGMDFCFEQMAVEEYTYSVLSNLKAE